MCLFTTYHLAAALETVTEGELGLKERAGDIFWPAKWKMFTAVPDRHREMLFEAELNGDWQPIPMEEWYPAQWESGYRWDRPVVYKWRTVQEPFLAAACEHTDALRVRMIQQTWASTLGQLEQPLRQEKRRVLRTWVCGRRPFSPIGRVL